MSRFLPALSLLLVFAACTPTVDDSPQPVAWSAGQPWLAGAEAPREWSWKRGIIHLHSPYSHDACDGQGWVDGVLDEQCFTDLRESLCTVATDFAFVTDHPSHAAQSEFDALFWAQAGDSAVMDGDQVIANRVACADGQSVLYMAGIEDIIMPVGLHEHVPGDAETRDATYNSADPAAIQQEIDAGGIVLMNHTEEREQSFLDEMQGYGMTGVEIFNLHAMVDPNIRPDSLGLDAFSWLEDIAPFTDSAGTAQPDLMFLAFFQEQGVTIDKWDTLLAQGPTVGVGGTDAHQNVFNLLMRDGERLDSYRRMMRWFSNWMLVDGDLPADYKNALSSGRNFVVFESLGTPAGLDVHLEAAGSIYETGQSSPGGVLNVACVGLHEASPRGVEQPEISYRVLKDGQDFASGCGTHEATDPGVYRVVIDIIPRHLTRFLGSDPSPYMHSYPWIYSGAIRVE